MGNRRLLIKAHVWCVVPRFALCTVLCLRAFGVWLLRSFVRRAHRLSPRRDRGVHGSFRGSYTCWRCCNPSLSVPLRGGSFLSGCQRRRGHRLDSVLLRDVNVPEWHGIQPAFRPPISLLSCHVDPVPESSVHFWVSNGRRWRRRIRVARHLGLAAVPSFVQRIATPRLREEALSHISRRRGGAARVQIGVGAKVGTLREWSFAHLLLAVGTTSLRDKKK